MDYVRTVYSLKLFRSLTDLLIVYHFWSHRLKEFLLFGHFRQCDLPSLLIGVARLGIVVLFVWKVVGHLCPDRIRVVHFSLVIPVLVEQRSETHILLAVVRLLIDLVKVQLRLFARNRLSFVFRVENFDPNDTSAVAEARLKPHEDAPEEDDDEDDVNRRHNGGLIDKLEGFFE